MHTAVLQWTDLGLSPIAFSVGPFPIRWYALSYMAMILLGWWYLRLLVRQPGAPRAGSRSTTWCRASLWA